MPALSKPSRCSVTPSRLRNEAEGVGEAALEDQPADLRPGPPRDGDGRGAAQGPSHDIEPTGLRSRSVKDLGHRFIGGDSVGYHGACARRPVASSVAPEIDDQQGQADAGVKHRDIRVVGGDFAVAVKVEDHRRAGIGGVEPAAETAIGGDGNGNGLSAAAAETGELGPWMKQDAADVLPVENVQRSIRQGTLRPSVNPA